MEQLSYRDNLKDIYNLYKLTFNSISIANQSLSIIPKVKNVIYQTKYKLLLSLFWGLICIYYHQLLVYSPILLIVFTWVLSIDSKLSSHLENSKEARIEKKIEGIQILFQEGKKMIHNVQEYKLIMIERSKEISIAAIMGFPIWKFTVDIIPLNYLLLIAGNLILFETIEDYKKIRKLVLIIILNHTFINTIINTLYDKADKLKLFYLNIKDEELVLFNTNNINYNHVDRYNNKQLNYNTSMSIPVTPIHKLSRKFLDMNKSNSNPLPLNTSTTVTRNDNESSLQSLYSLPLSKQSQSYNYEYNIDNNNKEGEINQAIERKELERVYSSTCSSTSSESFTPKPSEFMMPDYNQAINDDSSMEDKNISLLKIKFILFEYQRYHGKFGYLPQMLPNDPPNWVNNRNEPSQPKNLIELPLPTITYEIKENQKIINEYIWKWNTEWSFIDDESKELRDSEGWQYGDMKYGFHSNKEYVNYTFGLKKHQMRCRKWERVATLSKIVE